VCEIRLANAGRAFSEPSSVRRPISSSVSADDIPVWWIGLSIVILLVGIVIGVLVFTAFSSTANEWLQLIFLGALGGGVSLLLLFPAIRAQRDGVFHNAATRRQTLTVDGQDSSVEISRFANRLRIKTSSAPAARRVRSSNGKRFERLPFSILEPSRPALCETISAVDRPCRVRFKRNLRGLATVRAHRIKHLTRAAVVAASASSAASVFVHSLPTVRPLVGRTSRREGPRLLKVCTTAPFRGLTGRGAQRPKLMRNTWGVDRGGHRRKSLVLRHVNLE